MCSFYSPLNLVQPLGSCCEHFRTASGDSQTDGPQIADPTPPEMGPSTFLQLRDARWCEVRFITRSAPGEASFHLPASGSRADLWLQNVGPRDLNLKPLSEVVHRCGAGQTPFSFGSAPLSPSPWHEIRGWKIRLPPGGCAVAETPLRNPL